MVPDQKPMTIEDVQKLVGSLYLEIEMLRRHNQALREYIEKAGLPTPAPSAE